MNPIKHVAIIMDGNGRWGLKNKNSRNLGHKEGLKTVEKIIITNIENNMSFLAQEKLIKQQTYKELMNRLRKEILESKE